MGYPNDRKYTQDHEWALESDGVVTIGITDFAQGSLGDIVYVEVPAVGDTVDAGAAFGEVESVKSVSELISPISGEVIEINEDLEGEPEVVNSDPHGAGWMIRVRIDDPAALEALMDADAYTSHIG